MNMSRFHGRSQRPDRCIKHGVQQVARGLALAMIPSALALALTSPVRADQTLPATPAVPSPSSTSSSGATSIPVDPTPSAAPTPSADSSAAPGSPEPTAPSTAPSVTPPPPPGAHTSWSRADGSAPSTEWFDSWQQAVRTPAGGGNVLLPWESPSGQVQIGQGTAVTGGWSIVDANGNAGGGISCGSVCGSGWFPVGFNADGRPSSWARAIQQTTAIAGTAVTGSGRYDAHQGWVVPGPSGSHSWNWQTNELGPCIQQCAEPSPEGSDLAGPPADSTATPVESGVVQPASSPVWMFASAERRVAERATRVQVLPSGDVAVRVVDGSLRRGTAAIVTVRHGSRVLRQWQVPINQRGDVSVTVPRGLRGTRIEIRVGARVVGLGPVSKA